MKAQITTLLALVFTTTALMAQKVCNNPDETSVDPNSISLNKCDITENKDTKNSAKNTRKIARKRATRQRITKRFKTNPKALNSDMNLDSSVDKTIVNYNTVSNKLKTTTILFNLADELPKFPATCAHESKKLKSKCFKNQLQKHFAKYFDPESIAEDEISGKVLIKFDISITGKATNIEILSSKKSSLLEREIKKTLAKLPEIQPGKINGLPVQVTYVFPINLTLE
ncbi:conserved exported hypothetical protein [Tenacibaculum litopenaei]|uniref:energy transducer TonB n=1 Tax=Tenacibaculum litopenaei TaxID=396016 RepID=UPI003894624D